MKMGLDMNALSIAGSLHSRENSEPPMSGIVLSSIRGVLDALFDH